ncbi:MAG: glycogen/starch/alpha-glucan phosphorylase, partial [Myxococcaceae bacterium]
LADFAAYVKAQEEVARAYHDTDGWTKKCILNVARVGRFSSDRSIREYAKDIWNVTPVNVD